MTVKKRKYTAPLLETHSVDQEISLVMTSLPGNGNTNLKSVGGSGSPAILKSAQPFGGSTPDISNMN